MFLKKIRRDFGLQLLFFYLLLVIPALGIIVIFDVIESRRIRQEATSHDLTLAKAIAQQTDVTISNALNALEQLSQYPAVRSGSIDDLPGLFSIVQGSRPDIDLIYRLDSQGRMVYHYPAGAVSTIGSDFSFRPYFQKAKKSEAAFLSEGRISPTTEQPIATAVMPLRTRDNVFLGVIATNIKLEGLSATVSQTIEENSPQPQELQVFIFDQTGHVVAHADPQKLLESIDSLMPEIAQSVMQGESGSQIARNADNQEKLYTFAPIRNIRWVIVTSRPTAIAFAQQASLRKITLTTFLAFVGIGILLWYALNRRLIQPIEHLAALSQLIGEDRQINPSQREQLSKMSKRHDQIGELINNLARMEKSIQARMNEQATLLETSQAVVSSLETKVVLDLILEQVERLMNVQKIAIFAFDEQSGLYRVRASRGLSKQFIEKATFGPENSHSAAMRAIRAGKPVQISDTEAEPGFAPLLPRSRDGGYRAVLAVPLQSNYNPTSALLVFKPDPHLFNNNEIQLLANFANHAAMAMENAALYAHSDQKLKEQTRRLEALIQSMQDGLILGDLRGNVLYTNRRTAELANLQTGELKEITVSRLLARILGQLKQAENTRSQVQKKLSEAKNQDVEITAIVQGRECSLRFHAFDVTDLDHISIGRGIIVQDITADRENDRMKNILISTVSHELRTPLAAIKGYASTLLAQDVEWDEQSKQSFIEIISDEADRLSDLVNSLLDLSRLENGSLQIQPIECNIKEIITNAVKRSLTSPGYQLQIHIAEDLPPLYADQSRLETILRNLLENAAKYAGEQAQISIAVMRLSGKIIFRVEDDGPGIAPEQSERIFDPFYRVDNLYSRGAGGTGLGLAICRGLVQAHRGEIWTEPHPNGACFAFSIPLNLITP
ncbi:MAG: ATP-binding protein [Anaerolineales bacterium]|jgi:PAS domain S-box-containing protein|nr:ATP-binding protein [Anaerolineales bacterium]